MSKPRQKTARASRRLSWAGVSFEVPANWEIGLYKFLRRGVRRIEIEDEYSVRLEAEWVSPKHAVQFSQVAGRYDRAARHTVARADAQEPIAGLPPGWSATCYRFSETMPRRTRPGMLVVKQSLATAFFVAPDSSLFAFFQLHIRPEDAEDPAEVIRLLAGSFRNHVRDALVPWELFDIGFSLPREFRLEATRFDIGAKLMLFRWNVRRFALWYLSCADQFLKPGEDPRRWLAAYANDSRVFRGGKFVLDEAGNPVWRRLRRHVFGHRDEIARWCFRYTLACRIIPERNQLCGWAFHHRHPQDLDALPAEFRFDRSAPSP